ncbi:hypothetical protein EIN_094170 [Entamoeba invadens IP1]|uniref:Uncharacterized protein n=1 Tax=Entamoeba invadens IP1 TaxID=370355 RepID=A0A0A1U008_ENTIV|nr:hypothetical protein EIN_094170 [Entamoeba invadens IP1]ELP87230.1 hypothetical protein EIN_094170 [Entamoeba invadens IP1]|eukprot:XP_004254001.1 hypothetical protein EIN_094170 [Entamoeba invadens IP1]
MSVESSLSFYDFPRKIHLPTVDTYKQLLTYVVKSTPKITSIGEKLKNWKKHDQLAKRKLLLKFDEYLRVITVLLKKPIRPEFGEPQVAIGTGLIKIWDSSIEVIKVLSANEISEAMYRVILAIMNRSEFQPHHTVVIDGTASSEINCLSESYRKMLYTTYFHISDVYESFEDFLMASFRVEMTDDPMLLTTELPEEDMMDSASTYNTQDKPKPFPFHAQENILSVPIMTKILFGLQDKRKEIKKQMKDKEKEKEKKKPKKEMEKKEKLLASEITSLPEDSYFIQSGLSAHFLRFAPTALFILYFQMPSFQELFLDHIKEFPDANNVFLCVSEDEMDIAKKRLPRLFAWKQFHSYIRELGIDEQEDLFDQCGDTWLDLYHPGNDIFLSFYSQLVDLIYFLLLESKTSWGIVPGFAELTDVYLSEFFPPKRRHNLRAHKRTLKKLAVISPHYLSALSGLLLKTVNIFDFGAVVDVLNTVAKLHKHFSDHNDVPSSVAYALLHPIDSDDSSDSIMKKDERVFEIDSEHPADCTISAEELMALLEGLVNSDNCIVILSVLNVLFYVLNICCMSARTIILRLLLSTWFNKLFLHWSSDVRRGFIHLLLYRGTVNRRSHLNWDRFSKDEKKVNAKVLTDINMDLKEFDRNFVLNFESKVSEMKEICDGEKEGSIGPKQKIYLDMVLKEYNILLKQYMGWDKKDQAEVPPIKTDVYLLDDSY